MTSALRKPPLSLVLLSAILAAPMLASAADCEDAHASRAQDVSRTLDHPDPAIRGALAVLGQAVNPVRIAGSTQIREIYARWGDVRPPRGLNAFRARDRSCDPFIYVNQHSAVYTRASRKRSPLALLQLAATLAHEEVHNTDGEFAAYRLQSDFVRSRLSTLPWGQRDEAGRYLQDLDARAHAIERAEALARAAHAAAERRGSERRGAPAP